MLHLEGCGQMLVLIFVEKPLELMCFWCLLLVLLADEVIQQRKEIERKEDRMDIVVNVELVVWKLSTLVKEVVVCPLLLVEELVGNNSRLRIG